MRLDGWGRVDRSVGFEFTFDGKRMQGFAGDTLASALMANGQRMLGRSFKYHRPRGVITAGSDEPNALVTIGDDPNIRATMQPLYAGLAATSQNAWPSLNFDILAANDLMAPFFGAGFYYKTFMWPKAFWEGLYEPFIRRAAGLGALSGAAPADSYEKAFAHCDLLIIGAGPAGLMAALTAARAGLDIIIADEGEGFGGRLLSEREEIAGMPAYGWVQGVMAELGTLPNVRMMAKTTVTGAYDQGTFGALERVAHDRAQAGALPRECFWRISAKRAILAAGAIERSIAFANNDRPGIMLAGALRSYIQRFGTAPGKRIAIFGNHDEIWTTARLVRDAGLDVAAVIDSRRDVPVTDDFPSYTDAVVTCSRGRRGLQSIDIRHAGGAARIDADCLAVTGGWNPAVHLSCHMNGRPIWDDQIASFVPRVDAVPGMSYVGATAGKFSTRDALETGAAEAARIASDLGKTAQMDVPAADDTAYAISPLWAVPGKGRAWLDHQNDVSVKDVQQAARENFQSVEHMKRYTTQGMATDQGKGSNINALAVLADATGRGIPETGTTTFRPPYSPVALAAIGAGAERDGFAPVRRTTSDAASRALGAPMVEAGLWYRPMYFPQPGERTWRQSCDREVTMVRSTVGIADVTTLGKIDIKGADAGKFLDFLYINRFSTLKPGRVRYGLMLREDGHVMDDGTCACLGEGHYLMTTTTAAAGEVMRHMEFVHQGLYPEWDVSFASVTEHWAQFAIAGPKSRDLLDRLLDAPIDPAAWPFMSVGDVQIGGLDARLFRISFSGEHAYELAVPARFGASLYQHLLDLAREFGGGPYGMEALNVLRIEKGFLTHAEIHGRVTAGDVGAGGMMSKVKDFIGKSMTSRPGLTDPMRPQMVGLRPKGTSRQIIPGAHLFPVGADRTPDNDQGYVTSMCYSPTLSDVLALAFLSNGQARWGEEVVMVERTQGVETICEVVNPVFFDPEGERLRG